MASLGVLKILSTFKLTKLQTNLLNNSGFSDRSS